MDKLVFDEEMMIINKDFFDKVISKYINPKEERGGERELGKV
jgi:hypothetical protein